VEKNGQNGEIAVESSWWLNHPFLSKLDHFSRDRAENKKCLKSSPSSLLGLAEVVRSVPVRQEGEKKNHFFVGHS